MPEGDTVHLAARRLAAALGGRHLTRTDLRVPRLATTDLAGSLVAEVVPRGKHILIRIDPDLTLHTHFKMEGAWHLHRPGERWRGPQFEIRAVLENEEWQAVGYRLPVLELIPRPREAEVVGHLGPDVLGPDWDENEVMTRLGRYPERAVGEALLDQAILAGVGNVYKSEICFLSGVHPSTPLGELSDLSRIVRLTKRLMEANRKTGSQVTTGDPRPGRSRWVYGRGGEPCRRCRTPIRRVHQPGPGGARVTYWCPTCQPATARPTATRSGTGRSTTLGNRAETGGKCSPPP